MLLASLLRAHLRSPLPAKTRGPALLTRRFPSLHAVPVDVGGAGPVYLDLRDDANHGLFRDAPHQEPPWERAEQAVMHTFVRPGDAVFDIGANRGLHTVVLSRLVGAAGQVVAFEPNPNLLPCLRRTVGGLSNTRLVECALSDAVGEAHLFVPANHEMGGLRLHGQNAAADVARLPCALRTLDEVTRAAGLPQPAFVKIDVEGAELRVFQGARSVLDREDAPVVLYESNLFAAPGATGAPASAASEFLAALPRPGYRFYVVYKWGLLTRMAPDQIVHENILAVPDSRVGRWPATEAAPYIRLDG